LKKCQYSYKQKPWLTTGIKISCANKRKLYLTYRNSNNPNPKEYFKKYCRILTRVNMTAKKLYYNRLLIKSNNKIRTTWNIVKTITNNRGPTNNISTMNINDKLSSNPLVIANAFNSYFPSIAKNLLQKTSVNYKDSLSYLRQKDPTNRYIS
jgi:ribosomal protein L33